MRFASLFLALFITSPLFAAQDAMQEAVMTLGDRLGAGINLKDSRQDKEGVTLSEVTLFAADYPDRVYIERARFIGADIHSGELLDARALLLEGVMIEEDTNSRIELQSLFLEAQDLAAFAMMLGHDWADWQSILVASGVKRLEAEGLKLTAAGTHFTLKRFLLDETRYRGDRLEQARYRGEALRIPVAPFESEEATFLSDMGYEELVIDWEDQTRFEGQTRLKADSRTQIAIKDLGRFEFELALSGLPEDVMQLFMQEELSDEESMELMSIRLNELVLYYEDWGFLPRLYRAAARDGELTADEYAHRLADELLLQFENPQTRQKNQAPLLSDQERADLRAFILSPGSLKLSAAPKEGVSLMEVSMMMAMSWPMLIERLDVTLTARPDKP